MTPTDWRTVIKDPQEVRAFEALEDSRWDWRSTAAVARTSGLSEAQIAQLPAKYPTLVRRSLAEGRAGEYLYTLHSKYFAQQNPLQKAWTFLSSSSSTSSS